MPRSFTTTTLLLLCAVSLSCDSLDVPPPPDMESVLAAYANPTATVRADIMAESADHIDTVHDRIEDANIFELILAVVIKVQKALNDATNEDGTLNVEGFSIQAPSGVIAVEHICGGWDPEGLRDGEESPDRANGILDLIMPLKSGSIAPLVWGEAVQCRYLEGASRASFDGQIGVHFGEIFPASQVIRDLVITFSIVGNLGFDGTEFPIDQSFRIRGTGQIDILFETDDGKTFVYFFEANGFTQGVRDATGSYDCSLERRECAHPSGTFSW